MTSLGSRGLLNSWIAVLPKMVPVLPVLEPNIEGLIMRCHFGCRSHCCCKNDFGFISTVLTLLLMLTRFESRLNAPPFMIILYKRSVKKYNSSTKLITEPPKHRPKIPPKEAVEIEIEFKSYLLLKLFVVRIELLL